MSESIAQSFYDRPAEVVAPDLLGATLLGRGAAGVIVETEAYHEREPSCHAYKGRTPRTEPLFGAPGTAYVYFTYGMHWCFNVVCGPEGEGAAVLVRALVPVRGLDVMRERRARKAGKGEYAHGGAARAGTVAATGVRARPLADRDLCSGPAKLAHALDIRKEDNGTAVFDPAGDVRIVRDGELAAAAQVDHPHIDIAVGPRIGISVATDLPWRFGVAGSRYLSKPFLTRM